MPSTSRTSDEPASRPRSGPRSRTRRSCTTSSASTASRRRSRSGRRSTALSYLSSIGTATWARGRGLGELVTMTATADAIAAGSEWIYLGVFADNDGRDPAVPAGRRSSWWDGRRRTCCSSGEPAVRGRDRGRGRGGADPLARSGTRSHRGARVAVGWSTVELERAEASIRDAAADASARSRTRPGDEALGAHVRVATIAPGRRTDPHDRPARAVDRGPPRRVARAPRRGPVAVGLASPATRPRRRRPTERPPRRPAAGPFGPERLLRDGARDGRFRFLRRGRRAGYHRA